MSKVFEPYKFKILSKCNETGDFLDYILFVNNEVEKRVLLIAYIYDYFFYHLNCEINERIYRLRVSKYSIGELEYLATKLSTGNYSDIHKLSQKVGWCECGGENSRRNEDFPSHKKYHIKKYYFSRINSWYSPEGRDERDIIMNYLCWTILKQKCIKNCSYMMSKLSDIDMDCISHCTDISELIEITCDRDLKYIRRIIISYFKDKILPRKRDYPLDSETRRKIDYLLKNDTRNFMHTLSICISCDGSVYYKLLQKLVKYKYLSHTFGRK